LLEVQQKQLKVGLNRRLYGHMSKGKSVHVEKASTKMPINGKKVTVFTEGVWDMMHYNHIEFLVECSKMGNHLVVGVVSDASAMSYKRKPILNEIERLRTIKALPFVDEAFIFSGPFTGKLHEELCEKYEVDLVVYGSKGFDDYFEPSVKAGRMRRLEYRSGLSTSELLQRIKESERDGE
jgi:cytidyltransferase-like protein